jgi:DNA-binding transcriptional LysR family regulator
MSMTVEAVELAFREDLSVILADQLRADEIDLAFVSGIGRPAREQLTLHPLLKEPLVAALPPGHRLASRRGCELATCGRTRLIAFPEGATIRTTVFAAAARAGFVPGPRSRPTIYTGFVRSWRTDSASLSCRAQTQSARATRSRSSPCSAATCTTSCSLPGARRVASRPRQRRW